MLCHPDSLPLRTEPWKSCVCTFQMTDCSLGCSLLLLAGHPKQKSSVTRNGFSTKPDLQNREAERQFIQQMKEKCDEQTRRLSRIQEELKRTGCGFDVFVITTQHFFRKVGLLSLSIFSCSDCCNLMLNIISFHCPVTSRKVQPPGYYTGWGDKEHRNVGMKLGLSCFHSSVETGAISVSPTLSTHLTPSNTSRFSVGTWHNVNSTHINVHHTDAFVY